jgi:hypothetical protein
MLTPLFHQERERFFSHYEKQIEQIWLQTKKEAIKQVEDSYENLLGSFSMEKEELEELERVSVLLPS